LREWINDGLMTLFFFLVALEIKRELVLGELNNPRMAALSIAAALGGMLVPATLYLLLQWGHPGESGWGTAMATDTAFVIGCLALLGPRIPHSLRVFMLSLAIVDDIGAILVVAVGYSSHFVWAALALGALGIAIVRVMALVGFRGFPLYFLVGGFTWCAVDASGIHATVTGVILGLLTPVRRWDCVTPVGRLCHHAAFCIRQRRCAAVFCQSRPFRHIDGIDRIHDWKTHRDSDLQLAGSVHRHRETPFGS
jgi:NhaA family Na+:H+ antiporter